LNVHLTAESKILLALAARIVPAPRRAEWRREREAELWYWLSSHPEPGRLGLLRHCLEAFTNAVALRRSSLGPLYRHPGAGLAVPLVLIALIAAGTRLSRTRLLVSGGAAAPRVVVLSQTNPFMGQRMGVPADRVPYWRRLSKTTEAFAIYSWYQTPFGEPPREVRAAKIGSEFFEILGVAPALGRLFRAADERDCSDCAVLSYAAWRERFAWDPAIVGKSVRVDSRPARVIGVLPRNFWFLDASPVVWTLFVEHESWRETPDLRAGVIARLQPGVSSRQAAEELHEIRPRNKWIWATAAEPLASALEGRLRFFVPELVAFVLLAAGVAGVVMYGNSRRAAAFFLSNALAWIAAVSLAVIELTRATRVTPTGGTSYWNEPLGAFLLMLGCGGTLWWCWYDQRRRCRHCLRRLTLPVSIGQSGSVLFDPARIELVCPAGHGLLVTPEQLPSADPPAWTELDESWRDLFADTRK
jgi:hypothetical protein